jgi:antitoxin YqcF
MASESAKAAARKVRDAFGGTPKFHRHYDVPEQHYIDILSAEDRPREGLTSYSTLALHEYPNLIDEDDIRVELCGTAETSMASFANVVATCAFNVIKDQWRAFPAIAYPDVVKMYYPELTMQHIAFAESFLWEDLYTVHLPGDLTVHWLMVIPISESEYVHMHQNGWDALEKLFMEKEIDYWDLNRAPVV